VSGQSIRLSIILKLAVDFLNVMYIKDKQMLAFNFICDLLWVGRDSSVGTATPYGFDGPGIESRWTRFSAPVQTDPGDHPAQYARGTGSLSRG
jgi:hypothetical protein